MIRVLCVCTGNICRSPTAEAVLRDLARRDDADLALQVDSAGLTAYHVGEPPDERSQRHARRRGYDLSAQRARQLVVADFERFDWILAMDRGHLRELRDLAPTGSRARIHLLLDFVPGWQARDVPDPYYGGAAGFETVLDLVEAGCRGFLSALAKG